jgi:all-beta uncharacterized protein/S-layer family protein
MATSPRRFNLSSISSGAQFFSNRVCILLLIAALATAMLHRVLRVGASEAGPKPERIERAILSERISIQAAGRGNPRINLSDGRVVESSFAGKPELVEALERNQARALSLASADFDEDGVADLVSGYAGAEGGIITLRRGNVDFIYPNTSDAKQRRAEGAFTESPLLGPVRVFALPEAVDFIGAGDFDADGHWDLAGARRGGDRLYVMTGDGRGDFSGVEQREVAGSVTALVTGEINRRDGLTDLVIGINSANGPRAMVLEGPEGALKAQAEEFALPAEATSLALGQLDDSYEMDLAVAAGRELVLVRGRDRKLSLGEKERKAVSAASVNRRRFPFTIRSAAIGDFSGDHRQEVALLSDEGEVFLDSRANSKSKQRAVSKAIKLGKRLEAGNLISVRVSTSGFDDLIVIDSNSRKLQVLTNGNRRTSKTTAPTASYESASLEADGEPVAALPMRLNSDALSDVVVLRNNQSAPTVMVSQPVATFTVINTNGFGAGSLFEAILDANETPGTDTIAFNIPGAGPHLINQSLELPAVSEPVTIDGTTQPGFAGTPIVEVRNPSAFIHGLTISSGNSTVRGLAINGSGFNENIAIKLITNGGNIVEGNFIGADATGIFTGDRGHTMGVKIIATSNNTVGGTTPAARNLIKNGIVIGSAMANQVLGNFIGRDPSGGVSGENGVDLSQTQNNVIGGVVAGARNIISGYIVGVRVAGGATGNLIQGNFIGTDVTGTAILANQNQGIFIQGSGFNTIGGTTPAARNIISGNGSNGVLVSDAGNVVQGNFIGTDITGTASLSNNQNGVTVTAVNGGATENCTIGGTTVEARNIISGNGLNGVLIDGSMTAQNVVAGNYIGTDVTGTVALGNGLNGVATSEAPSNTIGGATTDARNIISANGRHGVSIGINTQGGATGITVQNNYIGTAANGVDCLGNARDGVFINSQSVSHMIMDNLIACNARNGVNVPNFASSSPGIQISIQSNSIYSNTALGIDIGDAGVTANDPNDPDSGANLQQNFPVLTLVTFSAGVLHIVGNLNSTPNSDFFVQFFSSGQCQGSNPGQNQQTLNFVPILFHTDASGNAPIDLQFSTTPLGGWVNCVATDATGNSSEFSPCAQISGACSYSIAPTGAAFQTAGGSSSVEVMTGAGCNWTASSNDLWINITSGASGAGPGSVNYSVEANTGPNRSGTMTIAGYTFTVTQASGCQFSIEPAGQDFNAGGGNGSVSVTAVAGCEWTASSNASFIIINSGASGTGNGTVLYTVAPNSGLPRSGTMTIAGQTFTVMQESGCTFSINPMGQGFTASGGTGFVNVASGAQCGWTATSNDGFITVTSGAAGTGNGMVLYSVAANTGPNRLGTMTIAGHTFDVTQSAGCAFTISPASRSFAANGGSASINVTTEAGCAWTATSNNPSFIIITSGASGAGPGAVNYSVSANSSSTTRSGTITVADQTFTVYQGIDFADVPPSHLFYTEIGKLAARGVTLGCGSGNFCPEATVTREQMAAFIIRALGQFNPPQPASQRFADVPPNNPFYAFIEQMAVLGITSGCGNGNYCPAQPVLREQMAAFIIRALGQFNPPQPASQRFADVPPQNSFYAFIEQMAVLGITSGCSVSPPLYCPGATVTRGQMAAFLVRAFNL